MGHGPADRLSRGLIRVPEPVTAPIEAVTDEEAIAALLAAVDDLPRAVRAYP